jgi:hypothetical protein
VLVTGEALPALGLAQKLRRRGARAVLELDEPSPAERVLVERAARLGLAWLAIAQGGPNMRVRWSSPNDNKLKGSGDEAAALDALAPAR